MTKFYQNEWAIILGASSGFGAASAKELAKAGLNICGIHLDRKAALAGVEELKNEILSMGVECKFFNVNASDPDKRKDILDEMSGALNGKVRLLLHSLAFGSLKPFIDEDAKNTVTQSQMEMTMDVMANSLVYWTQDLFTRGFFAKSASVYAMTSAGSTRAWKSYGPVSAAKAALECHCRQLALELAPYQVRVNAILAGVTDTPALRKIPGNVEMIEVAQRKNPSGRLTLPEDIGKALVALSLPQCAFMTGNTIHIDGGENIAD